MLARFALVAAVVAGLGSQAKAFLYTYHNGYGSTDHVDVNDNVKSDLWWANDFTAQPGGNLITDIHIAFGGGWTLGTPVTVLLYQDTDNNGQPDNLSLVAHLDSTIQKLHTVDVVNGPASVQSFDIPDTLVTGHFFVGALVLNAPALASARSELTSPQGRSFLALNEATNKLGTFDPANPNAAEIPPAHIETFTGGQGIDFYVEAVGTTPEPASLAILAAAGMGLLVSRGNRRLA